MEKEESESCRFAKSFADIYFSAPGEKNAENLAAALDFAIETAIIGLSKLIETNTTKHMGHRPHDLVLEIIELQKFAAGNIREVILTPVD